MGPPAPAGAANGAPGTPLRIASPSMGAEPAGPPGAGAAKKLGIKAGGDLVLIHAPSGWEVPDLSDGVRVQRWATFATRRVVPPAAVVVAFYREAARYEAEVADLAPALFPEAVLWALWPRRAAGHQSDLGDEVLRRAALALGLVDNKVAAVDQDWSGLRLVWRRELRARRR
jgi:hypothetical protein